MLNVLVVENDQKLSTLYCSFLRQLGFNTETAADAPQAVAKLESNRIDIMLCDFDLPGIGGSSVVDMARKNDADLPIIVMSDTNDLKSKQVAFSSGCDDYMVKPLDLNELALRISALLRRVRSVSKQRIVIGNAVLNRQSLTVVEGGSTVELPPKEFMVLFKLCSSPDRIFTRRDIMNDVWGIHAESGERTVDVHVKRLRERFSGSSSFRIETVRGMGYKAVATR